MLQTFYKMSYVAVKKQIHADLATNIFCTESIFKKVVTRVMQRSAFLALSSSLSCSFLGSGFIFLVS